MYFNCRIVLIIFILNGLLEGSWCVCRLNFFPCHNYCLWSWMRSADAPKAAELLCAPDSSLSNSYSFPWRGNWYCKARFSFTINYSCAPSNEETLRHLSDAMSSSDQAFHSGNQHSDDWSREVGRVFLVSKLMWIFFVYVCKILSLMWCKYVCIECSCLRVYRRLNCCCGTKNNATTLWYLSRDKIAQ